MVFAMACWLQAQMHEYVGPGKPEPSLEYPDNESYRASEIATVLRQAAPDAADAVLAVYERLPAPRCWQQTFSLLDERTAGLLMQAGASKFLRREAP